jgi:alpha-D-ribose 1-methylphosphonate 5-triphosphate synthase subunit PhnG
MFQSFDNPTPEWGRPEWLAVLARAPMGLLEAGLGDHASVAPHWLRPPETGLMMVQGRAGGTGERFNLGEVSVTRCALKLPRPDGSASAVGVAYVMGRGHRQARLVAVADALLQDPAHRDALVAGLLQPVRQHLRTEAAQRAAAIQSTRVEFFTVAREAGSPGDEEGEE